jgi:hypothetical protein
LTKSSSNMPRMIHGRWYGLGLDRLLLPPPPCL